MPFTSHVGKMVGGGSCTIAISDAQTVFCHSNFRFVPASRKEFLDIQATIERGFTMKRLCDMIRTYSQMQHTDKYSQHSSIILPVWLNGWVFVYQLSGCGFEPSCSHLNFRFLAFFEQGYSWHSGNYRAWIHSETRTWHDNIQSNATYR